MKDEIENQRLERANEDKYFLRDSHCSKCPRLLTRERNKQENKCDYCLGLRSVNDLYATSYKSKRKESQQTSESILEDIRIKREYNEAN